MFDKIFIDKCIEAAEKPSMPNGIDKIPGQSTPMVRMLLNLLNSKDSTNYLEVGPYLGSTLLPAIYNRNLNSITAIENWAYGKQNRNKFIDNCNKFMNEEHKKIFTLIEENCFSVDLSLIQNPIDVYFYDGYDTLDDHIKSIIYYIPVLADQFIFIVDDYNWDVTREGTDKSIELADLVIEHKVALETPKKMNMSHDSWWNGLGIFLLRKKENNVN